MSFQRPVQYDPTLARRLADSTGHGCREVRGRENLRQELGLSDDDDGDADKRNSIYDALSRREIEGKKGSLAQYVQLLQLRYLGCVQELQLVHARERRATEQLSRARQLAKSQAIIMWRTYAAKLAQKNKVVREILDRIRRHTRRHCSQSGTAGFPSCAGGLFTDSDAPRRSSVALGSYGVETPRSSRCGLVTDHLLARKLEGFERENVLLRATVRKFGAVAERRRNLPSSIGREKHMAPHPDEQSALLSRCASSESRAKAERAKLRKAVRIAKAVKVKLAHAIARQKQLEVRNRTLNLLLQKVRAHSSAGDFVSCRKLLQSDGELGGGCQGTVHNTPRQLCNTVSSRVNEPSTRNDNAREPREQAGALSVAKVTIRALEKQLEESRDREDSLRKENQTLRAHVRQHMDIRRELRGKLTAVQEGAHLLNVETSAMRESIRLELGRMEAAQLRTVEAVCASMKKLAGASNLVVANYRREKSERRRLFNVVQELRGNIRVFCRVRPLTTGESARGAVAASCVHFDDDDDGTVTIVNPKSGRKRSWEFDKVFRPAANNAAIFCEVRELCTSILDGYNVCIFAYGQTGSGKTYTMEGPESDRGVNFRALSRMFEIMDTASGDTKFDVTVSLLEIYNEEIRDLLAEEVGAKSLHVRQGRHGNVVPELTTVPVHSWDDVFERMKAGYRNRATAYTSSNEHSSRSHCIVNVAVTSTNVATGQKTHGQLHLVDLAGSERVRKSGVSGRRMKEALNINKSLSALGDVIQSRVNKSNHVPFRNSTLTHLLQDSLSKDSKTVMIVQVSPSRFHVDESFSSLNFAARAKSVELGRYS